MASPRASERVGWAWQIRATSSLETPKAIAAAASAIISPAREPRIWTPSRRSVWASANSFTPAFHVAERSGGGRCAEREESLAIFAVQLLQLFFGLSDGGNFRMGVDHRGDGIVIDVPVARHDPLDAGHALFRRLMGQFRPADAIADGKTSGAAVSNPLSPGSPAARAGRRPSPAPNRR